MKHAIESNLIAKNKDLVEKSFFLALKYVNEALTYLNYQKEFQQVGQIIECRQASIYFLLGKCHKFLKNTEMELEMFANSLDLYENILPQSNYNSDTCIKDRVVTPQSKLFSSTSELFDSIKNDDDEETVINYLDRIDQLYQSIEDSLIKMNKLKEAILVTERHRAKKLICLNNLTELLTFDQIEQLLESENLHAVIYFSRSEISSKLNCWLLLPKVGIAKFHQIAFKQIEKALTIKKLKSLNSLANELQRSESEDEQNNLLKNIYDLLIEPFENELFDNLIMVNEELQTKHLTKPSIYIVYDEDMLKIPFHLLKTSRMASMLQQASIGAGFVRQNYLFEIFEIDCAYSLKFLFKTITYNQKFVKHQADSKIPMKVISNENDMEKLLISNANTKNTNQYQFDLLLLLVDSENKGFFFSIILKVQVSKKFYNFVRHQVIEYAYQQFDKSEAKQMCCA
jgi:hypothetical protein